MGRKARQSRFLLENAPLRGAAALTLALAGAPAAMAAGDPAFAVFIETFWPTARAHHISLATYERAFRGLEPDPDVLRKAAHQPEFVKPIWEYLASAVSQKRIARGRERLRTHKTLLDRLERTYGVDRHILLAIWGLESSYGESPGEKNVVRSLATLTYEGTRAGFARAQLIAALKILERGDITADRMTGSWAGAMGHTQFIPTTYEVYAVDFNGDGRRDIWNSVEDALASTANYLRVSSWRPGETWGYEVELPRNFDFSLAAGTVKTLAQWRALGVRRAWGKRFPRPGDRATIVLPAGANGPAFAAINNYRAILRYNNADAYAIAIGHLADRIRDENFPGFAKAWPVSERPLALSERMELQRLLAARGLLRGKIDGVIGSGTKAAVRAYQRARGLAEDGYASLHLLERLRGDG